MSRTMCAEGTHRKQRIATQSHTLCANTTDIKAHSSSNIFGSWMPVRPRNVFKHAWCGRVPPTQCTRLTSPRLNQNDEFTTIETKTTVAT